MNTEQPDSQQALAEAIENLVSDELQTHPRGIYDFVLMRVEKPLIEAVMKHTGHNQSKTAEILGLNRGTLRKKIARYSR